MQRGKATVILSSIILIFVPSEANLTPFLPLGPASAIGKTRPPKSVHGHHRSPLQAFTLIELLVTIVILSILAGLLLPAVANAKLKARQLQSLNNVKQLALASFMYATDQQKHDGYDTPYSHGGWMGSLLASAQEKNHCLCPMAPLHQSAPLKGNAEGTADRAWVRWSADYKIMLYSSYGYNGRLYSDLLLTTQITNNAECIFTQENTIEKPAQTPVFVSANWVDLWPLKIDFPATDLYAGLRTDTARDNIGRCTIARHGVASPARAPRHLLPDQKPPGAINMRLADGHAELVQLTHLWNFYWHRHWRPLTPPVEVVIDAFACTNDGASEAAHLLLRRFLAGCFLPGLPAESMPRIDMNWMRVRSLTNSERTTESSDRSMRINSIRGGIPNRPGHRGAKKHRVCGPESIGPIFVLQCICNVTPNDVDIIYDN